MDLLSLAKEELIRMIYLQQDTIKALEAQIIELRARLNSKDNQQDKKTIPPFFKPSVKTKNKQEKKKRSENYARKRDIPTNTVFHSFELCPSCGSKNLGTPSVCYRRQIIDIPISSKIITENVVFKRLCFSCGKRSFPKPNLSTHTLGKRRIGINLMALIALMRQEEDMTLPKIQNHLKTFYDLCLSEGELVSLLHQTASFGEKEYEEIKKHIRAASVVYADETGHRENGKNGYTWSFSNKTDQLLLYRKSRASIIVREVLGEDGSDFNGVLVSDFYSSYNEHKGFHQRCWVHYLGDLDELCQTYPDDLLVKKWAEDIRKLYEKAVSYTGPPGIITKPYIKEQIREHKEQEFKEELTRICRPYIFKESKVSALAARGLKYVSELFTFVRFEGVNSHNNAAEQAVRKSVIQRKISGGTRSPKGSHTREILGSLFGTWKLRNLNPFEQTKLLPEFPN